MYEALLPTAALLIRTSRCPNCFSTAAAAALTEATSVTSRWRVERLPLMGRAEISSLAVLTFSRERPVMITWIYAEAKANTLVVA